MEELIKKLQGIPVTTWKTIVQNGTPNTTVLNSTLEKALGKDLLSKAQVLVARTTKGDMVSSINLLLIKNHKTKYAICFNKFFTRVAVVDLDAFAKINYKSLVVENELFIRGRVLENIAMKHPEYKNILQVFALGKTQQQSLFE